MTATSGAGVARRETPQSGPLVQGNHNPYSASTDRSGALAVWIWPLRWWTNC